MTNYTPSNRTDRDELSRVMRNMNPADQDRLQGLLNDSYRASLAIRALGHQCACEAELNSLSTALWWDVWGGPFKPSSVGKELDFAKMAYDILSPYPVDGVLAADGYKGDKS